MNAENSREPTTEETQTTVKNPGTEGMSTTAGPETMAETPTKA